MAEQFDVHPNQIQEWKKRLIDEIDLELPFYGSRRIRDELDIRGHRVNRKRVQRLMREMGIKALYPKRRTSTPDKGHKIYPYLLRDMTITRANPSASAVTAPRSIVAPEPELS